MIRILTFFATAVALTISSGTNNGCAENGCNSTQACVPNFPTCQAKPNCTGTFNCPQISCDNPVTLPGSCCPSCPSVDACSGVTCGANETCILTGQGSNPTMCVSASCEACGDDEYCAMPSSWYQCVDCAPVTDCAPLACESGVNSTRNLLATDDNGCPVCSWTCPCPVRECLGSPSVCEDGSQAVVGHDFYGCPLCPECGSNTTTVTAPPASTCAAIPCPDYVISCTAPAMRVVTLPATDPTTGCVLGCPSQTCVTPSTVAAATTNPSSTPAAVGTNPHVCVLPDCTLSLGMLCADKSTPVTGIDGHGCPTCPVCLGGGLPSVPATMVPVTQQQPSPAPVSPATSSVNAVETQTAATVSSCERPVCNVSSLQCVAPATLVETTHFDSAGCQQCSTYTCSGTQKCAPPVCIVLTCADGSPAVAGLDANLCPTCPKCPGVISSAPAPNSGNNNNGGSSNNLPPSPPAAVDNAPPATAAPVSVETGTDSGCVVQECAAAPSCPGNTVLITYDVKQANGCPGCPIQTCIHTGGVIQVPTPAPIATTPNEFNTVPTVTITSPTFAPAPAIGVNGQTCARATGCAAQSAQCIAPQKLVTLTSVNPTTGCPGCSEYACSCDTPTSPCAPLANANCVRPAGGYNGQLACMCMRPICTETATVSVTMSNQPSVAECSAMTSESTGAACTCTATKSKSKFSVTCTGSQVQTSENGDAPTTSNLSFMRGLQSQLSAVVDSVVVNATELQSPASTVTLHTATLVAATIVAVVALL